MKKRNEIVDYFVFFPFLKTSQKVQVAEFTLHPSNQVDAIDAKLSGDIAALGERFYISTKFRPKNMAIGHFRDRYDLASFGYNEEIHSEYHKAIIARELLIYLYSSQHPTFLNTFQDISACDMFAFRKEDDVVNPHLYNENLSDGDVKNDDALSDGYHGLLNESVFISLSKDELVYPSKPSFVQNHYQDIYADISSIPANSVYEFLKSTSKTKCAIRSNRIMNALRWYNRSNDERKSTEEKLLLLAVAFETLLGLSRQTGKTERFIESIESLLGRNERLAMWASQFYITRSDIVHEGQSAQLHFNVSSKKNELRRYRYLADYGRRIFQLILSGIVSMEHHRKGSQLDDLFVTNKDRYRALFQKLEADKDPKEKIANIADMVQKLDEFQYVYEDDLDGKEIICAIAKTLQVSLEFWTPSDAKLYMQFIEQADLNPKLLLFESVYNNFKNEDLSQHEELYVIRDLMNVTWHYLFNRIFQLKREGKA